MKVKQILAASACAALLLYVAPSTVNAATTNTPITVKWNTQAIQTLNLYTDYTVAAGVASQGLTVPTYFTNQDGGSGGICGGAAVAESAAVVNFFNVTPEVGADYLDCYYKNGADARAFTTDGLGYSLTVAGTLPKSCGAADCAAGPYILCAINANGVPWANNTGAANATASTAVAAPAVDNGGTNTCAHANGVTMATTGSTGGNILASQAAATGSNGADFGMDVELAIPPLAQSLNEETTGVTVTYGLVGN
jgi:hypothetical protein